jgi:hypothetical protein
MNVNLKTLGLGALIVGCWFATGGCSDKKTTPSGGEKHAHHHEHRAPHGGTAIVLGAETYHLELVRDAVNGTLSAYVLDGEMENFIRIGVESFTIVARVEGAAQTLVFKPVANAATGETVTDTSLYEASAAWLKTTERFDAVLTELTVRGKAFAQVSFNFPKGNEAE